MLIVLLLLLVGAVEADEGNNLHCFLVVDLLLLVFFCLKVKN